MKRKIAKMTCALLATTFCFSPVASAIGINPTQEVEAAYVRYGNGNVVDWDGTQRIETADWVQYGEKVTLIKLAKGEQIALYDVKSVTTANSKICPVSNMGGYQYNIGGNATAGTTTLTVTRKNGTIYKIKVQVLENKYDLGNELELYYSGASSQVTVNFKSTSFNVNASVVDTDVATVTKVNNNKFIVKATGKAKRDTFLRLKANGITYEIPIHINENVWKKSAYKSEIKNGEYDMIYKFSNVSLGNFTNTWKSVKCTWDYTN